MSNYAIIRHQKIRNRWAFFGIKAHNERTVFSKNINPERSHKNITIIENKYESLDDFADQKRKQIRMCNLLNGTKNRMVRKIKSKTTGETEYKSLMQEFVFTYSPDAMSEADGIAYCRLALEFIKEWYPDIEIVSAIIHLDETTPHIHIDVAYFDELEGRFCQSDLQKVGKTQIDNIRKGWQKKIVDAGFTELKMQDGSVVGAKHDGSKASKKLGELKEELQEYREAEAEAEAEAEELMKIVNDLAEDMPLKFEEEDEAWELKVENTTLKAENDALKAEVKGLDDKAIAYEDRVLAEFEKVENARDDFEYELETLKEAHTELENSLETALDEKEVLNNDLKAKNAQIVNLEQKLKEFEEAVAINQTIGLDGDEALKVLNYLEQLSKAQAGGATRQTLLEEMDGLGIPRNLSVSKTKEVTADKIQERVKSLELSQQRHPSPHR